MTTIERRKTFTLHGALAGCAVLVVVATSSCQQSPDARTQDTSTPRPVELTVRFEGLVALAGQDGDYWALLPKADYNKATTDAYTDAGSPKFPRGIDRYMNDVEHFYSAHFASLAVVRGNVAGYPGRLVVPLVEYGPTSGPGRTKITRYEVVLPKPVSPTTPNSKLDEQTAIVRFPDVAAHFGTAATHASDPSRRSAYSLDQRLLGTWNEDAWMGVLASRVHLPFGDIRLESVQAHDASMKTLYGLSVGGGACQGAVEMPELTTVSVGQVSGPVKVLLQPSDASVGARTLTIEPDASGGVELAIINGTGGVTFLPEPLEVHALGHLAVGRWYFNLTNVPTTVPAGGEVEICVGEGGDELGPICPSLFLGG
ncbi:MAG TPA: hypothetical protein VNB06_02285 [Thermoanaerobaculia bacterium]|nr:hypothetical protein [Thermoanaerobaculia bacterium]